MLKRSAYLRAVRSLGFKYKNRLKRTELYARASPTGAGTDRMYVSRNAQIDPAYARKELLRWGMTDGDFARIVADGSSK